MKTPIKLGFIGCGGHAGRHADVALKMSDDYKIVGALDTQEGLAESFLSSRGVYAVATTKLQEFLSIRGMDAVLIATPHKVHLDLCKAAIFRNRCSGLHVLCEKPLWEGPYLTDGQQILDGAEDQGLIFSSCHLRRYEEGYVYVKEHLREYLTMFGPIAELRFQFFYHEPSTDWKMRDSLLLDHMNHEIDLVHFLFGYSPATFWRLSHGFDEYQVAGKTESGLKIWFSGYRRLENRVFRNELELVFRAGRVRVVSVLDSVSGLVTPVVSTLSFEDNSETVVPFRPHSYDNALVGVMKNFAMAIRNEEPCYLTHRDLLVNTSVCNDLLESEHAVI